MSEIRVSIIITSFNYARFLPRCIEACLEQDMPRNDFEIVVVDDASTDDTASVLDRFKNSDNVRSIIKDRNEGVAAAANCGLREARGQFVTRVDADDVVATAFIRKLATRLEDTPGVFCVCCDYELVDPRGRSLGRFSARTHPISCGIMYRRTALIEAGLYAPEWRHLEEKELRARLGDEYTISYLDENLYSYLRHDRNKTNDLAAVSEYQRRLDGA